MEEKIFEAVTSSVERVFRYLIPGVAFFILLFLYDSTVFNTVPPAISESGLVSFLVVLAVGMTIYVIYSLIIRFSLERIAFKCKVSPVNEFCSDTCICHYSRAHAELLILRNKKKDYPSGYYTYLWSITHYAIIFSIMVTIYAIVMTSFSVGILGVAILVLSIWSYFYMQKLEKDTISLLKLENDKASPVDSEKTAGE